MHLFQKKLQNAWNAGAKVLLIQNGADEALLLPGSSKEEQDPFNIAHREGTKLACGIISFQDG